MNIGKMMKDLQKMQSKLQQEMDTLEVEASSGGEMVTVRMNGRKEVIAVKLGADAITPDDPELLEDLIVAAFNEAGRKVDAEVQDLTQGLAPGMNLPGLQ
jgi:DNA-binding YbaB/EbfC family protein